MGGRGEGSERERGGEREGVGEEEGRGGRGGGKGWERRREGRSLKQWCAMSSGVGLPVSAILLGRRRRFRDRRELLEEPGGP